MTDEHRRAKELDDALAGRASGESELVATAAGVTRSLATDVPPAERQRALFVNAVGAREKRHFSATRLLVPALGLAVIAYAVMAGRGAVPGERLYPLRKALNAVGVTNDPVVEVDDHLHKAALILRDARLALATNPGKSIRLAVTTLEYLGQVRAMLPELGDERRSRVERIEELEDNAVDVMGLALEPEEIDDGSGPGSSSTDDNSGSNSGVEDSSGSGSDDDNSGSGSDDSSGSGSADDSSDDSGGSGSSDSGSDDDDSGSGSDDSGSGSDDSSGSGSSESDSSGSGSGDDDSGSYDDESESDSD